ncbi:hypothetical protein RYX36_006663 [Vicia faba]
MKLLLYSIIIICYNRRTDSNSTAKTILYYYWRSFNGFVVKLTEKEADRMAAVNAEYIEEPATNVKFQTSSSFPGCTDSLTLFGTGFREKVFAIIGVKVYAAGLYLNQSIVTDLKGWKGKSKDVIQGTSSLFNTIFQSPLEKSLQIFLSLITQGPSCIW